MTPDARIAELVAYHRGVDQVMRELPLYNHALVVEASRFEPFQDGEDLGILTTPWFMNLILLSHQRTELEPRRYGERRKVALPGGERAFRYCGDPSVGAFWAAPLHSPMESFRSAEQARAEARVQLEAARTPPDAQVSGVACPSRRILFTTNRRAAV